MTDPKTEKVEKKILVVGVDEVGRGCLAGPVTVAACILPVDTGGLEVKDSKKYASEKARERVYDSLTALGGLLWSCHSVDATLIDMEGIRVCTLSAMTVAVLQVIEKAKTVCGPSVAFEVRVDGCDLPPGLQKNPDIVSLVSIVRGDQSDMSISAASVLAKVTRDRFMNDIHKTFPEFHFDRNKGYGTKHHRDQIAQLKWTPLHRCSFEPLKSIMDGFCDGKKD